jgi:histidinol-phosphate aminotransferase
MTEPSRREFVRTIGASAAALAASPVFERGRAFAATPGAPQGGPVLLNYNESPYGPSPRAVQAVREASDALIYRYHVEDHYDALRSTLASHHGVTPNHIRIGAGSTEFLKACDDVFLSGGAQVVVAEPAYEAVLQYAANSRAATARITLTSDLRHDLDRMAGATTTSTGLVYICNPNNPTGTIVRRDEIARFMARVPASVPVLVDEAYAEFVTDSGFESAVKYVREGRNVIVAKTFSKIHGLAGMRIGYAIAKPEIIAKLTPQTVDFAVTGVAANAALASMRDREFTTTVARSNATERTRFVAEMKNRGFTCAEPHGNFVLVNIGRPVGPVIAAFRAKNVLVGREFSALPTWLRVSLGTKAKMDAFYVAAKEALG